MQTRYIGDIKDYVKYALLRHLQSATKLTLGVNWYFTCPKQLNEKNSHGKDRAYIEDDKNKEWESLDKPLYQDLQYFQKKNNQSLKTLQKKEILPAQIYVSAEVPCGALDRKDWHKAALKELERAEIIFLDPDTGLPPKTRPRHFSKYVLYEEVAHYIEAGKIIICIQFPQRNQDCKIEKANIGYKSNKLLNKKTGAKAEAIFRVSIQLEQNKIPDLYFWVLIPTQQKNQKDKIKKALEAWIKKLPHRAALSVL